MKNNLKTLKPLLILTSVTSTLALYLNRNNYKKSIYGNDKRGGDILSFKTYFTPEELEYNRTF